MKWRLVAPLLIVCLALGAVGALHYQKHSVRAPEAETQGLAAMPKGPAIAVLPFVNLSGDQKEEYFSDGLTEDILIELSRAHDLHVLARNSTFQYKDNAVDAVKLGRELEVGYVLKGSIQRTGTHLRVSAQLIDTETGANVWADRYDRDIADVFLVQDEIVREIVAKIAGGYGVIQKTEAKSAAHKSALEIQAYDLVLRAHDVMQWEWSRTTYGTAKELLRQAIILDPLNSRALREQVWLALVGWVFRFEEKPEPLEQITAQSMKAVQLDPSDARTRMVAASAYFFNKQLNLFEQEAEEAMKLAPFDAEILAPLGSMIASSGQWERGIALLKKAHALNADATAGWYESTLSNYSYLVGDYPRALQLTMQNPDQQTFYTYIDYLTTYGQLGRKREALDVWRKLLAEDRNWSAKSFEDWYRVWNFRDQDIAKFIMGVHKSGVLVTDARPYGRSR